MQPFKIISGNNSISFCKNGIFLFYFADANTAKTFLKKFVAPDFLQRENKAKPIDSDSDSSSESESELPIFEDEIIKYQLLKKFLNNDDRKALIASIEDSGFFPQSTIRELSTKLNFTISPFFYHTQGDYSDAARTMAFIKILR